MRSCNGNWAYAEEAMRELQWINCPDTIVKPGLVLDLRAANNVISHQQVFGMNWPKYRVRFLAMRLMTPTHCICFQSHVSIAHSCVLSPGWIPHVLACIHMESISQIVTYAYGIYVHQCFWKFLISFACTFFPFAIAFRHTFTGVFLLVSFVASQKPCATAQPWPPEPIEMTQSMQEKAKESWDLRVEVKLGSWLGICHGPHGPQ